MNSLTRYLLAAGTVAVAGMPASARACATCFGKSDDLMAQGMNMGIFALLIVILSVLAGIAAVGVFFARRSARLASHTASPEEALQISQPVSHSNH